MNRQRILMFVQDGSGLGHLSRMCRIAMALQTDYDVLIVTGKKESCWMVPNSCEFIKIPSWKNIRFQSSRHWGNNLNIHFNGNESIKFVSNLYVSIADAFKPDVIINDYLPFGKFGELKPLLEKTRALKCLVMRGVIDTSDKELFLGDNSLDHWNVYQKIFIANDPAIFDFLMEYSLYDVIGYKAEYVGYVSPEEVINRKSVREKQNIPIGKKWIVCSAGGGINAEECMRKCIELSKKNFSVFFDIVLGPYNKIDLNDINDTGSNCRIRKFHPEMSHLIAGSDISIINGGYNSLIEAVTAGTNIIVYPNNTGTNDEQLIHAKRFSTLYPMIVVDSINSLEKAIYSQLNSTPCTGSNLTLMINGQQKIRECIEAFFK